MNSNILFNNNLSNKNISFSDICSIHKEKFISYCKLCTLEICNKCLSSHFNHELINYKKIRPQKEEIELLQNSIKKYQEIFNNILTQIFSWKKFLEKIILSFQHDLNQNQKINENLNFIFNNDINNYTNFNSILKFRQLFNSVIEPQKNINNNKILNYMTNCDNIFEENKMGLYEYNNYNKIKLCLEKINYNNNSSENNFLYNTNCIIDILWENYISKNKNNNINNNINHNQNKKIIEKYIDLSQHKKISKNKFSLMKECSLNDLSKTQSTFKPKIGNIFLEPSYLNTSNDTINYTIDNNNSNNSNAIYSKKRSYSNNNIIWNKNRKNISFNIKEFNANLNINKINFFVKQENPPLQKIKSVNLNNKTNNPHKGKSFFHKKFEMINLKKFVKNSSKKETNIDTNDSQKTPKILSKSEKNKVYGKNSFFLNNSDNKLNSTCNSSDKIKQKLNFDFLGNDFNLLNNDLIKENEIIYKLPNNKNNNNNSNNNNNNNISFISNNIRYTYILSPNQILSFGLDIGNLNCKLGLINPNPNQKNNPYIIIDSIPFMLSFNEKTEEIDIGPDAFNSFINNSETKLITDIVNLIGKNFDEINLKNYFYEIFSKNNKPYIKINLHGKEKNFNFEDLFTIYIKKLFQKFFDKIEVIGNDNNFLQINLVIAIPDDINYFQRKIIEKIFQSQIFPSFIDSNDSSSDNSKKNYKVNSSSINSGSFKNYSKKLYGGYQIILKDIKIENNSSIIHLSYKLEENNSKNILAIVDNGDVISISLGYIFKEKKGNEIKDIYEIKNVISLEKGEINLINDFIEKMNTSQKNINDINNLRKILYQFFFDINKTDEENSFILNEFIKSLNNIYKEVISSILKILQIEKLTENNINQIIIEGKILKTKAFIELLSSLFKSNKEISYSLNNINNNNNIILGSIIQSYNLGQDSPLQILKNISPMSFGIDSFGIMEFIIKKGDKVPFINNKKVKIKNDKNEKDVKINIYEGENREINKNRIIFCIEIDKSNFKKENIFDEYVELVIQFELDCYFNLKVFVLDNKNLKKRFECLINFDIKKE